MCEAQQGSIFEPLFFLILINDLMFHKYTNLFFERKGIKVFFAVVNRELLNNIDLFILKNLSLNVSKSETFNFS